MMLTAVAALGVAADAPAQSVVVGEAGVRGASVVGQGTCGYRIFGPRGVLQVGIGQPAVGGANTRPRRAGERTYVRYRVFVTDAWNGYATVTSSGWSGWLTLTDGTGGTWSSPTVFDMDWRGNYGADVRIEWWNARRMVGWRAQRVTAFGYYDQFNTGPYGPMGSCAKASWDRPLPG